MKIFRVKYTLENNTLTQYSKLIPVNEDDDATKGIKKALTELHGIVKTNIQKIELLGELDYYLAKEIYNEL